MCLCVYISIKHAKIPFLWIIYKEMSVCMALESISSCDDELKWMMQWLV